MALLQEAVDYTSPDRTNSPKTHFDFFRGVRQIYISEGVDPNGNEMSYLQDGHLDIDKLQALSRCFIGINTKITTYVKEHMPQDTHVPVASEIGEKLTPVINNLFIDIVAEHQKGETSESWIQCNFESVQQLRSVVNSLRIEPKYKTYFEVSPEAGDIFHLFAYKLPEERSYEGRKKLFDQIDQLSRKLYTRNLPTWIAPESTYYLNGSLQEPTLRLIFPAEGQHPITEIEEEIWRKLIQLHSEDEHRQRPNVFVGWQVLTTGSDIPSLSTAEWLTEESLIFLLGAYKTVPLIQEIANKAAISISEEEIVSALFYIYLWHELGHPFYNLAEDRTFEETDTDLTTLYGVLTYGEKHQIPRLHLLLCLYSEYKKQADQVPTDAVVIDGYRLSGIRILQELFDHKFIIQREHGVEFHPEIAFNPKRVLEDHHGIHTMNPTVLNRLRMLKNVIM